MENYGITTEFCRCNKSFVFAKCETDLQGQLLYSFSKNTNLFNHCWRAGDRWCTYFVFASSDEKIWVLFLNWILKETTLHAQLLACFLLQLSIPQWDILCLTSLTYQPTTKSRNRSGYLLPCQSENKHIRLMLSTCMKMKVRMINFLYVQQQQERNRSKEDVIKPLTTKILHFWFLCWDFSRPLETAQRQKRQDPTAFLEWQVSWDSREREEETSILGKKPECYVKRILADTAIHEQNGYAKLLDHKYNILMTNVDNDNGDVHQQAQAQHARGLSTPARW